MTGRYGRQAAGAPIPGLLIFNYRSVEEMVIDKYRDRKKRIGFLTELIKSFSAKPIPASSALAST